VAPKAQVASKWVHTHCPAIYVPHRLNMNGVRVSNGASGILNCCRITIMSKRRTFLVALFACLAAALAPAFAHADSHDEQFDCRSNPHAFISSLIDENSIDPRPSRVEANSVNAFRPAHGGQLSAFGFPIYMVIGYEHDDALFHHGSGKEIGAPLYGVVVSAPADSVRLRLREANSDATVQAVVPLMLTAIVCGGSQDRFPPSPPPDQDPK
jgi:hypothetical protein